MGKGEEVKEGGWGKTKKLSPKFRFVVWFCCTFFAKKKFKKLFPVFYKVYLFGLFLADDIETMSSSTTDLDIQPDDSEFETLNIGICTCQTY